MVSRPTGGFFKQFVVGTVRAHTGGNAAAAAARHRPKPHRAAFSRAARRAFFSLLGSSLTSGGADSHPEPSRSRLAAALHGAGAAAGGRRGRNVHAELRCLLVWHHGRRDGQPGGAVRRRADGAGAAAHDPRGALQQRRPHRRHFRRRLAARAARAFGRRARAAACPRARVLGARRERSPSVRRRRRNAGGARGRRGRAVRTARPLGRRLPDG
eukprot:3221204-Prymnesium_polylepis.1